MTFSISKFNSFVLCKCLYSISHVIAPPKEPALPPPFINPCVPSPCGPNSQCQDIGGTPSCSCQPTYIGSPPNCRPECVISSECASNLACLREKCRDPCPGSCGAGAQCSVINHTPICTCPEGYTGDPFTSCFPRPSPRKKLDTVLYHSNWHCVSNAEHIGNNYFVFLHFFYVFSHTASWIRSLQSVTLRSQCSV